MAVREVKVAADIPLSVVLIEAADDVKAAASSTGIEKKARAVACRFELCTVVRLSKKGQEIILFLWSEAWSEVRTSRIYFSMRGSVAQ